MALLGHRIQVSGNSENCTLFISFGTVTIVFTWIFFSFPG